MTQVLHIHVTNLLQTQPPFVCFYFQSEPFPYMAYWAVNDYLTKLSAIVV